MKAAPGGRNARGPRGAWWLPAGLVLVGLSGYVFLGVVGHRLGPGGAAPLAVLWTVTNVVGAGLFVPVEQELTRRLAAGAAGRVLRSATRSTAALLAVLVATAVVVGPQIDRALFAGQHGLTWCCVATCVGFAVQHLCRGVFAASGRFDRYGIQLAVDGLVRMAGTAVLGAAGTVSAVAYGAVLAVAPVVSLAVAAGVPGPGTRGVGSPSPTASTWGRDFGLVTAGQIGSTLIIGLGPVAVTLLARPIEQAAAAVLIGVMMLARVPLLGLYAAQAVQLPALTRLAAGGRMTAFRRRTTATLLTVLGATVVAGVAAWIAGPFAVATALGSGFRTGGVEVAVVTTATMLYIGAALMCQALLAVDGHGLAAVCWFAGVATYLLVLLAAWPIVHRVGAGFLGAGAVTLLLAAVLLRHRCRVLQRPRNGRPALVPS